MPQEVSPKIGEIRLQKDIGKDEKKTEPKQPKRPSELQPEAEKLGKERLRKSDAADHKSDDT